MLQSELYSSEGVNDRDGS